MIRRGLVVCLLAALAGCKPNEVSKTKAIIGAVLIDGNGGPPITDSVIVVSGSRIRSAGLRAHVPIPAEADKINGSGKFLIPGLIDLHVVKTPGEANLDGYVVQGVTTVRGVFARPAAPSITRLFTAVEVSAAGQIAELAAQRVDCLHIEEKLEPAVTDAILEEARKYKIAVTARIATLAGAERLVNSGVAGFLGMIGDTTEIDQVFLAKLRALNIVFTPALAEERLRSADEYGRMLRNTKRLAAAGVPIGVGSSAPHREMELLVEAGLSPLEVTTAATRHGALALRKLDELGTLEAGRRADLVLLDANPLEDVRNFRKIDRVMVDGEWVDRGASKAK